MIVYPAMDLMGGRAVRLAQGRFEDATTYPAEPDEALAGFAAAGAAWAHVVDLDGARVGSPRQHALIGRLAGQTALRLQVGGGFRTREQIAAMFEAGVARVVIGSLAVKEPRLVRSFLAAFGPDRITLAFDVKLQDGVPFVATSGWTETSTLTLWEAASLYPHARHLLLTDVGRDGMLAGPNFALLDEAVARLPEVAIQASGGIASVDDLTGLSTAGVIVGKALWERRFTLAEALDAVA